MVIASNEWFNNYEDEQKLASANTTSTTTNNNSTPTNVPATTSAAPSTVSSSTVVTTVNTASTTTTTIQIAPTVGQTIPSPSTAIDEHVTNISSNNTTITEQQPQQRQQESKQHYTQEQQVPVIINNKHMMADDLLKSDIETKEIENNNSDVANTAFINNSSHLSDSLSNTSIQTIVGGSPPSHNTATITTSNQQHPNYTAIISNYNPNPITSQALSKALQSALNSTSNNAGGVDVNLPNNYLSSISDIGISTSATLQHTTNLAKQFSSSLCVVESQTTNSSSNTNNNTRDHPHQLLLIDNNGQAKIVLQCEPNSHPFQTRTILLTPNIECKVGRLIAKSKAAESNAIFDCKVLSRNHAVLWYTNDGKFWVKDTKSSNGTFINESKLGTEAAELHFGDVVKFGVDVMENSRKEVHGCIIAGVSLYLPDGRETISIETGTNQLSPHTGESRISFDELHRLNLCVQEASQREKLLKLKLFNIQNILDATRKNSAVCWQSMIAEDQLLHRIHSLEKKLQIMEKNVPENVLRNEVLKLLDDKSSYQHSAKEALRKVYQERCDAMQIVSKMEAAFAVSDNECKILRDQIMYTNQSLQDVNARLLCLQTEYNEFKDENDRKHQEAKEQSEQRIAELMEKLQQRELECKELRGKISELLIKRADLLGEEQLQKQVIDNLNAAITDMDLDDDDEEEEDENDGNDNDHEQVDGQEDKDINALKASPKQVRREGGNSKSIDTLNVDGVVVDERTDNGSEKEKLNSKSPKSPEARGTTTMEDASNRRSSVGKKSTILKWLENSDLNKKEGLLDIFDAICNESDSSDSSENGAGTDESKNNKESLKTNDDNQCEDITSKCANFNKQLKNVEQNLSKLEAETSIETKKTVKVMTAALDDNNSAAVSQDEYDSDDEGEVEGDVEGNDEDDDDDDDEVEEEDEILAKRNAEEFSPVSKNNERYLLLRTSVSMLREAYNEICAITKQQQKLSAKPAISLQTQFQNYAQHKISKNAARKLSSQTTLIPTNQEKPKAIQEAEEHNFIGASGHETDNDYDDDDNASVLTARLSQSSLQTMKGSAVSADEEIIEPEHISTGEEQTSTSSCSSKNNLENLQDIETIIKPYQNQARDLNAKLELNENNVQNTIKLKQIECDAFKSKVMEMTKLLEALIEEKQALEQVINENKSNKQKTAACFDDMPVIAADVISEQLMSLPLSSNDQNTEEVEATTQGKGEEDQQQQQLLEQEVQPVVASFDQQMREELAAINNGAVQREEELIMYKERLEKTQCDNLRLQQEISEVMREADAHTLNFLKSMMPYGAIAIAILVYFIFTYF